MLVASTRLQCIGTCPYGMILLDLALCDGTGYCREACLFWPILLFPETSEGKVCLACRVGNEPLCVKYCNRGALQFEKRDVVRFR